MNTSLADAQSATSIPAQTANVKATVPKSAKLNRAPSPKVKQSLPTEKTARIEAPQTSARLQIKSSGKGKQESWTVKTTTKPSTKGSNQTSFRVRVSDVGFRVCLVYYDDEGKRRERYLCYLSATEWKQSKRDNLAMFVKRIAEKLADRTTKENADSEKLIALIHRINALA
ncbi:MAG: hypothetical protein JNK38_27765 [Acidobacteria bacterium]|nr:hypothetical protein [Acidobacteriota bacterium]